jgi:hypothetical protein
VSAAEVEPLGGTWRNVGGVMRWSPEVTPSEVADLQARMRPMRRRFLDVHAFIACPTCEARADERCHSPAGNSTMPHKERIISVRCACGQPVERRKLYCEPCRKKARKQTYRLREIRQPSSERRAS